MKWGVRRYQDKKGRLTSASKKRHDTPKQRKRKIIVDTKKIVSGRSFTDELLSSSGAWLFDDYVLQGTMFAGFGKAYAVGNLLGATLSRIEPAEE